MEGARDKMGEADAIIKIVESGGLVAMLIIVVVGFWKEWWYPAAAYRRLEKEKNEWKEMALRSVNTADKAVTLASDI